MITHYQVHSDPTIHLNIVKYKLSISKYATRNHTIFGFSEGLEKFILCLQYFSKASQNYCTSKLSSGRILNILKERPLKKTVVHYETVSLIN